MELGEAGHPRPEEPLHLAKHAQAGERPQRVAGVRHGQVGDGDDGDVPGGELAVAAGTAGGRVVPGVIQAAGLVDARERLQHQVLVVPQRDRPVLVAQPLAHPGGEGCAVLDRPATEGREGLADALHRRVRGVELADRARRAGRRCTVAAPSSDLSTWRAPPAPRRRPAGTRRRLPEATATRIQCSPRGRRVCSLVASAGTASVTMPEPSSPSVRSPTASAGNGHPLVAAQVAPAKVVLGLRRRAGWPCRRPPGTAAPGSAAAPARHPEVELAVGRLVRSGEEPGQERRVRSLLLGMPERRHVEEPAGGLRRRARSTSWTAS